MNKNYIPILFFTITILTLLLACGSTTYTSTPRQIPNNDISWIPTGFKQWDNSLAFRFAKGVGCSYSTAEFCDHLEVFARYGCPSLLYVEASYLNASGTQIDWGNDSTTSLAAGEKALLEFVSFYSGITQLKITKISCY